MSLSNSTNVDSSSRSSDRDNSNAIAASQSDSLDKFLQNITKPVKNIAESWDMDISDILEKYSERIRLIHEAQAEFDFVEVSLLLQKSAHLYGKRVDSLYEMVYNTLSRMTIQKYGSSSIDKRLLDSSKKVANQRTVKRISNSLPETEFVSIEDILKQEMSSSILNLLEDDYLRHAQIQSEKIDRQLEVSLTTQVGQSHLQKNSSLEKPTNDLMEDLEDMEAEAEDTPQFLPHLFQLIQGITDDNTGLIKLAANDVELLTKVANDEITFRRPGLQMADQTLNQSMELTSGIDNSFSHDNMHVLNTSFGGNTSATSENGRAFASPYRQFDAPELPSIHSPSHSFREMSLDNSTISNQEVLNLHDNSNPCSTSKNPDSISTPEKIYQSNIQTPPPISFPEGGVDTDNESETNDPEVDRLRYLWVPLDPHSQSATFKPKAYKQKNKYVVPAIPKQKAFLNLSLISDQTLNIVNINEMETIFPISFSKFEDPVSFHGLYHADEFDYMMELEKRREKSERLQKNAIQLQQSREYQYSMLPEEDLDEDLVGENDSAWPISGLNTSRMSSKSTTSIARATMDQGEYDAPPEIDPVFDLPPINDNYNPDEEIGGEYYFQDWRKQYVSDVNDIADNLEELNHSYEDLCKEHVQQYLSNSYQYMQTGDIVQRVRDWEENVKPLLKEQNSRPDYDIKRCTRQVVKTLKEQSKKKGKKSFLFSDVCQGKEEYEVCRMFLATLQLASTQKIEVIVKSKPNSSEFTTDDEQLYVALKV